MKNNKILYLKFILCGVAVSLPYIFPALWFLAYVSLVPMVYLLKNNIVALNKRRAYFVGLCFGIGYFGAMFHWFTEFYPMEFAGVTPATAILLVITCWVGLTLLQAIEFGFVTLLYKCIGASINRRAVSGALFVSLWVIFEWQQTFFFRGVPWARLAITQSQAPFALQSASLFGGLFVSGLIVFINVMLENAAEFAMEKLDGNGIRAITGAIKNKKTAICAAVAAGVFILNTGFGAARMLTYDQKSERQIKAAVVQANISSLDKWSAGTMESLNMYLSLTEECVNETGAQMVLWPESVIPANISYYPTIITRIAQKADELDIILLVGAFDRSEEKNEDGEYDEYNAIYYFTPDGKMAEQRYHKQRLVPFGEYVPMEKFIMTVLPILDTFNLFNDPLSHGEGSQVFETDQGNIGSLICFDSIYDYLTENSVKDGAELITVSTNDSWFSDSPAVYQHNSHGKLRAIESGRYVIRAASTGVSSIFSPTGQTLAQIEPLTEGYTSAEVYFLTDRTLYSYIGNVFVYICIGFVFSIISYKITVKVKSKK